MYLHKERENQDRDYERARQVNIVEKAIVQNPYIIHSNNGDNIGLHTDWLCEKCARM